MKICGSNHTNKTKMKKSLLFAILLSYGINVALYAQVGDEIGWETLGSINEGIIQSLVVSQDGFVYAGTFGGGVCQGSQEPEYADWYSPMGSPKTNVLSLTTNGSNIFAGTDEGVFFSPYFEGEWTKVNNGLTDTVVHSIAASGSNVFAGTEGGVFLSTDNGSNWTAVNNGLSNTSVRALTISGSNIYAGTSQGGLYLSNDNGSNWSYVNTGYQQGDVKSIVINGSNIYLGNTIGGVFLSTDNGSNWAAANNGLTNTVVNSIAISGSSIFAGTDGGVFLSSDNGSNWASVDLGWQNTTITPIVNAICVPAAEIVVVGTHHGIFVSMSNGLEWEKTDPDYCPITNVSSIATSGSNVCIGSWGGDVVYSSAYGYSAANIGLSAINVNSVAISGSNVFAGSESKGVFLSTDNGGNWTPVNNGLSTSNVNSIAINGSNIFAGTNGGGAFLSTDNGSNWAAVNNGLTNDDVRTISFSESNIFAGTNGGGVFLSDDNGSSWTAVNSGFSGNGLFINAIAVNDSNIFAGTNDGVFLSTDNGSNWVEVNNGLSNTVVFSIATSADYLFAGTDGGVFLSRDNGKSWALVSFGFPDADVRSVAISGSTFYAGWWGVGVWTRQLGRFFNLSVSTDSLSIGAIDHSTTTFDTYSNFNWQISSSDAWLTINPMEGYALGQYWERIQDTTTITVTAEANPSTESRTAVVTVSGDEVPDQTIVITQEGKVPELNVDPDTLTIGAAENSTASIDVFSNINWTVASSETWLAASITQIADNRFITLTAQANHSAVTRTAIITVSGTDVSDQTVTVIQDGAAPALILSPNSIIIAAPENSTATFDVLSNTSWTVSSSETWLAVSPNSGSDTATITITAEANTATGTRAVVVTVTATGVPDQTVMVVQNGVSVGMNNLNPNTLIIYPNPAKDRIFINTGDYTKMDGYQLKIVNQTGAVVFETNVEEPLYEVNLSAWTGNGLYFLQLFDDFNDIIEVKKIVIQ